MCLWPWLLPACLPSSQVVKGRCSKDVCVFVSVCPPVPHGTCLDAVALKSGRAKVPLWCELEPITHSSERQCCPLGDGKTHLGCQMGITRMKGELRLPGSILPELRRGQA